MIAPSLRSPWAVSEIVVLVGCAMRSVAGHQMLLAAPLASKLKPEEMTHARAPALLLITTPLRERPARTWRATHGRT